MSFKHNCSKFYLLTNKPVIFTDGEKSFTVKLPSLQDIYINEDLNFFLDFVQKDLNEVKGLINVDIETHYDFIHLVLNLTRINSEFNIIGNKILSALKSFNEKISFIKYLQIEDIIITKDIFFSIVEVILMSLDKEMIKIKDEDDEFDRAIKQAKMRAQKIRNNAKETKDGLSIEDMLVAILYEYPQYKLEDLMIMNLHTIYYLFRYIGKIANYEVSIIAAGNGLTKKHNYFVGK